jgi:hypothetical protein
MTKAKAIGLVGIIFFVCIGLWLYFSTKGANTDNQTNIPTTEGISISDEQVSEFVLQTNFTRPNFGGKTFIAFQRLGEDTSTTVTTVYIWLVAQEYYVKDTQIEKGSGISIPLVLYFENGKPITVNAPRDGSDYANDIQKMFPARVIDQPLFTDISVKNEIIGNLMHSIDLQAQAHFGNQLFSPVDDDVPTSSTSTPVQATSTDQGSGS